MSKSEIEDVPEVLIVKPLICCLPCKATTFFTIYLVMVSLVGLGILSIKASNYSKAYCLDQTTEVTPEQTNEQKAVDDGLDKKTSRRVLEDAKDQDPRPEVEFIVMDPQYNVVDAVETYNNLMKIALGLYDRKTKRVPFYIHVMDLVFTLIFAVLVTNNLLALVSVSKGNYHSLVCKIYAYEVLVSKCMDLLVLSGLMSYLIYFEVFYGYSNSNRFNLYVYLASLPVQVWVLYWCVLVVRCMKHQEALSKKGQEELKNINETSF